MCASGQGHSSYVLYGRRGQRRFSIYIPERLVPEIRSAIDNGRLMQELLTDATVRYVEALKKKGTKNTSAPQSAHGQKSTRRWRPS